MDQGGTSASPRGTSSGLTTPRPDLVPETNPCSDAPAGVPRDAR